MSEQRHIDLNPRPDALEVFRIIYPADNSRRRDWVVKPMRFIPHSGRASQ